MIGQEFFRRDPLVCARELIGAELIWGKCAGLIVETEAYSSIDDEASHTFVRPSARDFVARHVAGTAYVYFSYGTHWMLNVLVKGETNGFVLFRALQPTAGIALMRRRRGLREERKLCSGPGKLTQALNITRHHHELNLCGDPAHCFEHRKGDVEVVADLRIGITKSAHLPWRFTLRDSPFVSVRAKPLTARAK
jgi:DNA-3-methyladenine glycosylase